MKFLTLAKKQNKSILDYASKYHTKKVPLSVTTFDNENFIFDNNYKYFLTESQWNELYHSVITNQHTLFANKFDLNAEKLNVRLEGIREKITLFYNEIVKVSFNIHAGRPDYMEEHLNLLKDLISTFNIELFLETTINHIQRKVLHSVIQDELSANFTFEIKEVKLAGSFDRSILNTCFYSFSNTNVLFNPNTETKLEGLESLFALIFSYYQEKIDFDKGVIGALSLEEQGSVGTLLREIFNLETNNILFLEFVCKTIISKTLKNALNEPNSIQFISIMDSLTELGMDTKQIYIIHQLFQQSVMDTCVLLGSVITNYMIEFDIFQSISKIEDNKTVNYLSLNHELTYNFIITSTNFRPYFHNANIKLATSLDLEFIKDNVNINFKLNNVLEQFHFNKTGTGFFNGESIFSKEPTIGNMKVAVYKPFLDEYLSLLEKLEGKPYNILTQKELKGYLTCYLSLFDINFTTLLENPENMIFIKTLIEYAVNFDYDNPNKILHIFDQQHCNIIQRAQFLSFFHKICSYKSILKLCLADYIVYSNVNFVIIPCFYDLTCRKYCVGISFNPQTYQFVKGFIKLSEPHISLISEKDFTYIAQAECSQINNVKLKQQLAKLMSNYSTYKQLLLTNIQEFLYSFLCNQIKGTSIRVFVDCKQSNRMIFLKILDDKSYRYNKDKFIPDKL